MRESIRNGKMAPFTMVDKAVLMDESLSVYDKMVYCILCAYADKDSRSCFPSYQTIARKAGCSRRKAISVVAHLEELSLIEKREQRNSIGDNTSNLYTVKPMKCQLMTRIGASDAPRSSAVRTLPDAPQTLPDAEDAPERSPFKQNQLNKMNPSIYRREAFARLKEQIEYAYFEENFPDRIGFIDSLLGYMLELRHEGRPDIRRLLYNVDSTVILEFLEEMKGKSFKGVKNIKAYLKKSFIEFLHEREVLLATI